ncbi:hypothetical protein ACGFIJ_33210 [Microbispora bryophytorum]|uniref:hypothetical protein n=1 Tax=Microbispora bryophytorum TaxID=1460882 RepID=UPI003718F444
MVSSRVPAGRKGVGTMAGENVDAFAGFGVAEDGGVSVAALESEVIDAAAATRRTRGGGSGTRMSSRRAVDLEIGTSSACDRRAPAPPLPPITGQSR